MGELDLGGVGVGYSLGMGGGDRREAKRRYDGRGSGFGLQRTVDFDD